jgi:hypothetical protein
MSRFDSKHETRNSEPKNLSLRFSEKIVYYKSNTPVSRLPTIFSMTITPKITAVVLLSSILLFFSACGGNAETASPDADAAPTIAVETNHVPETAPTPKMPNLQAELLDERNKTTDAPIGKFDFKNYKYPLPRGWQDAAGEIVLENGKAPVSLAEEERKIGASYVATKFADATGDGADEAFVIVKLETGGSAIPQIVYVFEWRDEQPELIWYFRTGDRADGGLKDIRVENGEIIVELFGQDRYIVGELDTMKITGDEEQICCPTYFTRSRYKWNGNVFRIQGKRLTFSMTNPDAPPIENMIEVVEKQNSGKK